LNMKTQQLGEWFLAKDDPPTVTSATQTATAVVVSYLIAHLFRLPESYWAPIATLIVIQSTLRAALPVFVRYFAGTAVGAAFGAVMVTYFQQSVWAYGAAVLVVGLLCVALQVERSAYRYASITLAIVMLPARSTSVPSIALHRFFEVSIGLSIGLAFVALRPKIRFGDSANTTQASSGP
jgi:uncharacterized membrane protein YgaE (UPF0421/DUF939 family)